MTMNNNIDRDLPHHHNNCVTIKVKIGDNKHPNYDNELLWRSQLIDCSKSSIRSVWKLGSDTIQEQTGDNLMTIEIKT